MSRGHLRSNPWVGLFLLLGGVVLAGAAIGFAVEGVRFLDATSRANGVVTGLERERGHRGSTEDHPVVRFVALETGETVEFTSAFGIWPSPFGVADQVEVAYDPDDLSRARINSFWTIWFLPCLLGSFGLACAGAGTHTLRQWTRREVDGVPDSAGS